MRRNNAGKWTRFEMGSPYGGWIGKVFVLVCEKCRFIAMFQDEKDTDECKSA